MLQTIGSSSLLHIVDDHMRHSDFSGDTLVSQHLKFGGTACASCS